LPRKEYTPEQVIGLLREAEILIENWYRHSNAIRPHAAIRAPAPKVLLPPAHGRPTGFLSP
jgi:hypothetical protein